MGPNVSSILSFGADGLHSTVRKLVFGSQNQFEKYLGYKVAEFEVEGYRPRDELVYLLHTELHQQAGHDSPCAETVRCFFLHLPTITPEHRRHPSAKGPPAEAFANSGWECPQILASLSMPANELYFDRVSQIRMDTRPGLWTQGRVTLARRCGFLRFVARRPRGPPWPWWRLISSQASCIEAKVITFKPSPDTSILRPICSAEAESCLALCRILCPKSQTLALYSQPGYESSSNSLGRGLRYLSRNHRQSSTPTILTVILASFVAFPALVMHCNDLPERILRMDDSMASRTAE